MWKEVLCLGRHCDPKTGQWHEFKPAHIKRAHRNFQKMRARGVPVPAIWEHQKDIEAGTAPPTEEAVAEWKRNYARYTFAHLEDSRINGGGNLEMLHDVADPRDVEQLAKTKYVSPKVYNAGYWDTRGGEYDGTTIAHVAATPTPVQFWQKPFQLSDADAFYLSYCPPDAAPAADPKTEISCPGQDWSFDAWLAELDAADQPLDLSATEAPEGEPMAEDKSEKPSKPEGEDKGGADGDLKELMKALKAKGMSISDKVSTLKELIIAVESSGMGGDETPPEPEPEPAPADDATTDAGGPPMLMSTLDKDVGKRKQAETWAKDERAEATARINAAMKAGRLAPPDARRLLRQAGAVELSFTDGAPTGKKWQALLATLAEAEKKPANSVWSAGKGKATDLSTTEVPAPNLGGGITPERAQLGCDIILGKKSVKDA